jgi:hypothetical protein
VAAEFVQTVRDDKNIGADVKAKLVSWAERASKREIFVEAKWDNDSTHAVYNLWLSQCFSCDQISVWRADTLLYPTAKIAVEPNPDMDADIRDDFIEAALIIDRSPRGAAALLRLAIQKLLKQIGESGESINADIGALVAKGLDVRVQKALDLVRVIGNDSVHPGTIDRKDDRATAVRLFDLVNRIAYDCISHPKELSALYDEYLTDGQKDAIAKRDTKSA